MSRKITLADAFPVHGGPNDDPRNRVLQGGLTKLEWFAGMALSGILAAGWKEPAPGDSSQTQAGERATQWAYAFARAMIAEGEKTK